MMQIKKIMTPTRNRALRWAPIAAALLLAGCAAPALTTPEIDIPSSFKESNSSMPATPEAARWKTAQPAEAQARGEWWKAFGDPVLNQLITEAATANPTLAAAAARVKQARAIAGVAESDRIPAVGAEFGPSRAKATAASLGMPAGTSVPITTLWQARLVASYELDLFGRVTNNISAARADAQASEANFQSVLLALQADTAQTYFRLQTTDAEIAYVNDTVKSREESLRIQQRRYDSGDISELDLARAKTDLSVIRSEAAALQRQRAQLEHALAILLGKSAANVSRQQNPLTGSFVPPTIPPGLPSSLLERRPDISAAQLSMMAANARIGAARAAVFPALRLTAAGGAESTDLSDLFQWSSRTWVIGALLSLPVIDGGRNRNAIARSEAALEEAVASYRQIVISVFAEVEDNLVGLRTLAEQAHAIDDAVASGRRSQELAEKLYRAGRGSYLEFLDAQRNLTSIERNAVQLRGARATSTVALIRSLGGGW